MENNIWGIFIFWKLNWGLENDNILFKNDNILFKNDNVCLCWSWLLVILYFTV